ncbi:MAG TPA: dihydroxyacetone kinase subunit L, partial [Tissierellaceae bacterium]|nr:dihydroxyacetone kinase subunit L [Tissierellaceae bacterium]
LYNILSAMLEDIMKRGKTEVGSKTMVDALAPAVEEYKAQMDKEADDKELLEAVAQAAKEGAEATRDMEAIRGRASYQANKGVGHLDPGAVTMAYQIEILCNYILQL